ncbi:MAG TPA: 16S rRNA (uracil(1498)-N(3))-methyltransferase [Anaeromyxobacter sp.]|nr:16S rRNA (uracil(1498)-N(3))-methyltransferase [Anaeromyxobacter sp.]
MNLFLLDPSELRPDGTARLDGRRAAHARDVLRAAPGDRVLAGVVGGRMGEADVLSIGEAELVLRPALDRDPPPPSPVALLLALPRPKILRRVLQASAAMGVKRIALVGSWRVEKSYFGSPFLAGEAIRRELLLGLEQGRDTALPEVTVHRLFKPFVEDALDAAFPAQTRLLAHPAGATPLETVRPGRERATLAVGPEGGWTAYEADRLRERGFAPFTLGPRALRVDAAVPYAVGQVELWLRGGRSPLPPRGGRSGSG